MIESHETAHRRAALKLLSEQRDLNRLEAGFLGQMTVTSTPSVKQYAWLERLLGRYRYSPVGDFAISDKHHELAADELHPAKLHRG